MKVLALILALIGVGGASAVAAPSTPSYVQQAPAVQTGQAAPLAARDAFSRPPRMVRTVVVVKPAAKPVAAHKKAATKKVQQSTVKTVTKVKKTSSTPSKGKCGATCQWHKTDSVWAKYPAWVQTFALCVSHHESWSPHMWTAENPISTASGGFQWIDGSWRTNMKRAGFSGPGHAAYASPVLQAEVTAWVIAHNGQWNWKGTHCGFGT